MNSKEDNCHASKLALSRRFVESCAKDYRETGEKEYLTLLQEGVDDTATVTVCRAYERNGKCGECRACWNKTAQVIAYPAHGVKMAKVIKAINLQ